MNGIPEEASAPIIDTTDDHFEIDVMERSKLQPVVVDFWADWCQPCRMLAPMLEKLAQDLAGQFALVRAEVERNQRSATAFQVSALPTVYGVVDGEPVDFFTGVLPQDQIASWIDRLLNRGKLAAAHHAEQTDAAEAERLYRELLAASPHNSDAAIGLARVCLQHGHTKEAHEIVERLEARGFLEPAGQKLKAQLNLQERTMPDLAALRAAVAEAPEDFRRQLDLAAGLAAQQQFEEALETALEVVRKDRKGLGEQAREFMVDIFHVLPEDSELIGEYRRKLATALY